MATELAKRNGKQGDEAKTLNDIDVESLNSALTSMCKVHEKKLKKQSYCEMFKDLSFWKSMLPAVVILIVVIPGLLASNVVQKQVGDARSDLRTLEDALPAIQKNAADLKLEMQRLVNESQNEKQEFLNLMAALNSTKAQIQELLTDNSTVLLAMQIHNKTVQIRNELNSSDTYQTHMQLQNAISDVNFRSSIRLTTSAEWNVGTMSPPEDFPFDVFGPGDLNVNFTLGIDYDTSSRVITFHGCSNCSTTRVYFLVASYRLMGCTNANAFVQSCLYDLDQGACFATSILATQAVYTGTSSANPVTFGHVTVSPNASRNVVLRFTNTGPDSITGCVARWGTLVAHKI